VRNCEKFGKIAKNSIVLVNFVAFWGHFTEMEKVRKKSLILAGTGMRFAIRKGEKVLSWSGGHR
jgi:hypothetical protein